MGEARCKCYFESWWCYMELGEFHGLKHKRRKVTFQVASGQLIVIGHVALRSNINVSHVTYFHHSFGYPFRVLVLTMWVFETYAKPKQTFLNLWVHVFHSTQPTTCFVAFIIVYLFEWVLCSWTWKSFLTTQMYQ
jgi:hypothetical protein